MLENCTTICDNTISMAQDSEPSMTIEGLNLELQHSKSVCEYYKQSKSTDLENLKMKQKECKSLKLVLQQKNEEIQNLRKEMEEHRNAYKDLQEKLTAANIVENICDKAVKEKVKEALKPYFTDGQIRCILEQDRKWIHWSIDDYASAISLCSISPKTYTYLRLKLNYPLPSLSSLRRWALEKFDIQEGFLHDVLAVMREKGKQLTEFERIAVVTFDEMSLSPEVCFDSKIEKLIGPCKKVQVIMVRGLFSKWKQPIYYKFDQPMTKSILLEAAKHLYDAGYMIVAVTISDMGNKGVWKELNISPTKYWFEHPVKKDTKIFVFADVPHLLKLLRNWFIDDGCLLPNCKEPFTAAVFQSIIDMNKAGDLHVAHRLTQRILDARNTLRQAVRPAAQIWSHTSAKAIEWAGQRGLLNNKEYSKFSDFVEVVNDWFDVHNSQLKYGAHPGVNGFGVDLKKQQQTLMLMNFYIEKMKVGSRKVMMPFQKGILISNSSLRELYDKLKSTHQQFEYIMTRRLQQDILENFFDYIRAMGSKDHPSGYDFRYRLRWYILGKHSHAVFTMNRNTEEDETASCISSCSTDNVSSLSTAPKTPSTPVIATISSAVTSTSVPSTSMHMHSSTPLKKIKLFAPESIDTTYHEFSYSEINNDHSEDEIILTQELFENIINISPEELKEDSRSNELIDEDRADDF